MTKGLDKTVFIFGQEREEPKITKGKNFTCEKCNEILSYGTKFCPVCGTKCCAEEISCCKKCGAVLNANAKFCGECGQKVENAPPPPAGYKGPWRLTEVLEKFVKENEISDKVTRDLENGISRLSMDLVVGDEETQEFNVTCFLEGWEAHETFKLFIYFSEFDIAKGRVAECLKFINVLNASRALGYLSLVNENKSVRCYWAIDVEGSSFETQHIKNMLYPSLRYIGAALPHLNALNKNKIAAEDLLIELDL